LQVLTTPTKLKAVWGDREVVEALPSGVSSAPYLAYKELFTVLVALFLWGTEWAEQEVLLHTTSPGKVEVLVHGKTRDLTALHMARCIWLTTARCDIRLKPCAPLLGTDISACREKWAIPQSALDVLNNVV
jgi:hypothetical protein